MKPPPRSAVEETWSRMVTKQTLQARSLSERLVREEGGGVGG